MSKTVFAILGLENSGTTLLSRLLGGVKPVSVPYPDLSSDPDAVMGAILKAAGVAVDPAHLKGWNDLPHQMLGGNRMLRSGNSTVAKDQSWQTRPSGPEKLMGRLFGTLTYRRAPPAAERPQRPGTEKAPASLRGPLAFR